MLPMTITWKMNTMSTMFDGLTAKQWADRFWHMCRDVRNGDDLILEAAEHYYHHYAEFFTYVCPGCGDPEGPCPNASCVRNDDPGLCDYRGNPLD